LGKGNETNLKPQKSKAMETELYIFSNEPIEQYEDDAGNKIADVEATGWRLELPIELAENIADQIIQQDMAYDYIRADDFDTINTETGSICKAKK